MKRLSVGLDIGGTKCEVVLIDEDGIILFTERTSTSTHREAKEIISDIKFLIRKALIHGQGQKFAGIGLGVPGVIHENKIVKAANLPSLEGHNLVNEIKKEFMLPVKLENDANCMAIAEYQFGAGKGSKNMVGVAVGTGISSGIIINGLLYSGTDGLAGAVGHIVVKIDGRPCPCGGKGHLEAYASGRAIKERYLEAVGFKDDGNIDAKTVITGARNDDPIAMKIMDETIDFLSVGFANIINTYDPDMIVVGGGLSNVWEIFRPVEKMMNALSLPVREIPLKRAEMKDSAGVMGAAAMMFDP